MSLLPEIIEIDDRGRLAPRRHRSHRLAEKMFPIRGVTTTRKERSCRHPG